MFRSLSFFCAFLFSSLTISLLKGQAWTKKRSSSSKIIDSNEDATEPDPSVFGNFAAMNELAKSQDTKKIKSRRRDRGAPGIEDLMNQMAGGGMAEMLNQMGGGGDMTELLKGLGNLGGKFRFQLSFIYRYSKNLSDNFLYK